MISSQVVLIIAAIFWVVTINNSKKSIDNRPVKIGVSTMLSGDWAALGNNIVNAAKLAVVNINSSGGINGREVQLVVQDSGLDSKTGLSAVQKLINTDGVRYIIGGTSSNGTMASAPVVNQNHVIYMTPVTGGTDIDSAGEYVFRTANSDLLSGRDLAEAAYKLGYKKVDTITEVTSYTLDMDKTFENTFKSLGGVISVSEQFQPGTTDFRTIVAKVKSSKPDAVLVLSQTGIGGAHFVKQVKEVGISGPFFTDFTFMSNADVKKIIGSFEGIYFADPAYNSDASTTQAFFSLYQKVYGTASMIPFHAASTYDSVMMLADSLRAVGDDNVKVHDWLLSNIKNWNGLMGTYSLDAQGNSNLGFTVKVIKGGVGVPVN